MYIVDIVIYVCLMYAYLKATYYKEMQNTTRHVQTSLKATCTYM